MREILLGLLRDATTMEQLPNIMLARAAERSISKCELKAKREAPFLSGVLVSGHIVKASMVGFVQGNSGRL